MAGVSAFISEKIALAVGFAIRRAWITAVVILGLAAASLYYAAGHLKIDTDTAGMMSASLQWRQDFDAYRNSFPNRDRNIVAVIDAPNPELSLSYARELAAALAAEPELFPTVFFPGGGEFFEQNGLLYLPIDELEELADQLIDAQPLLGRLADDLSGAGLFDVLRESVEQGGELSGRAARDLDRIFAEIGQTLAAASRGERHPIAWGRLIGVTADLSARQLVLIKPEVDFNLVRPARAAIERIREIGGELGERYGDDVSLRLTGTLAMEHEELSSITRSASTAGLAALAMVVIVLFWALRSPVLLVISVVVLLAGLSLTAAFAAAVVKELNLLSVAFAVLYIGLGVDFVLHMCLRLEELKAEPVDLDGALIDTARGVGSSLFICAVTTAAGFFAFMPTEFVGVSELGLISGVGMLISLLVSLSLLPALIRVFWRGGSARRATGRQRRGRFSPRPLPPGLTIAIAATAAFAAILLLPSLQFDGNPIHLRDPDAESIRTLEELAADSEAPLFHLAVLMPDEDAALAVAGAIEALDTVASVQTVASLVPAGQTEKLIVIDDMSLVLGATLAGFGPAEPDAERFTSALEGLIRALGSDTAGPGREDFRIAAEAFLFAARSRDTVGALALAGDAEADVLGNLVDQIGRLERGLHAEAFGRVDLPGELVSRFVNAAGEELVEVTPREDLNDNEAAARFVSDVRSVAPNATGLPVVYEEAAATVTRAFATALAYALGIVSLLLVVFLRNLRDVVLVLIPILFAAVLTAGISVLIGLPLNFANIIALPLLVGVGVDSGIHMVHRMRTEPPSDGNPLHTSTSRAVLLSALTTIASFGNLAFSTHVGMASMGQLLTLGMLMSLVAVLGLLPALLRVGRAA